MNDARRFSLVKPTLNTPFHIDFDWWKQNDNNWRIYLHSYLCPEHQAAFDDMALDAWIDWIDPDTAEVRTVDGLQHVLMNHCAHQPDFIHSNNTLVDSVFRVFLAHGNQPMTPIELAAETNRPAQTILRTFTGLQVYKGIRPRQE